MYDIGSVTVVVTVVAGVICLLVICKWEFPTLLAGALFV